eukprot:3069514-Amphidinium_carterae.1
MQADLACKSNCATQPLLNFFKAHTSTPYGTPCLCKLVRPYQTCLGGDSQAGLQMRRQRQQGRADAILLNSAALQTCLPKQRQILGKKSVAAWGLWLQSRYLTFLPHIIEAVSRAA